MNKQWFNSKTHMSDTPRNKVGRPRKTMKMLVERGIIPENWKEEILQMGREGKSLVYIVNYLNVNWDTFYRIQERDKEFLETVNKFQELSEQWWMEIARQEWIRGNSKSINSNHWSLIMRNMFKDRWSERKEVDITSKGNELNKDNTIQVEILGLEKEKE